MKRLLDWTWLLVIAVYAGLLASGYLAYVLWDFITGQPDPQAPVCASRVSDAGEWP